MRKGERGGEIFHKDDILKMLMILILLHGINVKIPDRAASKLRFITTYFMSAKFAFKRMCVE